MRRGRDLKMVKGMISVVIPVYNAEKYLQETIQSVLNQTYQNFEIVAVNDGSSDHSLEILQQFDDARLRIISKDNSGVSDTRNVAIEAAEGEYVCFLDSDDYLAPQYIQRLYDTAIAHDADMVVCNYTTFRGSPAFNGQKLDAISVLRTEVLVQAGVLTSAWTKLIKLSTLYRQNIVFDTNMTFGEDLFFCWKALLAAENVWFIDEKLYGYRMTGDGATSKFHPNLYEKYKAAFAELKDFGKSVGKDDEYAMDVFFATRMPSFIRMTVREKNGFLSKVARIQTILTDKLIRETLDNWEKFTDNIPHAEISFYEKCRQNKAVSLLFREYKNEAVRYLKEIVRKIIWVKED